MIHNEGLGSVFFGEEELAKGMASHILNRFSPHKRRREDKLP